MPSVVGERRRESLLGPVRRREFELWIHRDGNAAALVAIEVELPADRSRPDAGLVTLSGLIGGGTGSYTIRAINC